MAIADILLKEITFACKDVLKVRTCYGRDIYRFNVVSPGGDDAEFLVAKEEIPAIISVLQELYDS